MHSSDIRQSPRRRSTLTDNHIFSGWQYFLRRDRRQHLSQQYSYSSIGGTTNSETLLPLTMSSFNTANSAHSSGGKKSRSSVLGASKKIVKATVRRPLRTVGRIVGRGGRSNGIGSDDLDLGEVEEVGEEVILREIDDGDASVSSSEIIVSTRKGERDLFRGSVHNVRGHTGDIAHHRRRILSRSRYGDPDWPVHAMERFLRQIMMVLAAFILGAKRPEFLSSVTRLLEYAATAWATCFGILLLAFFQHRYPNLIRQMTSAHATSPSPLHSREIEAVGETEVNERTHLLENEKPTIHERQISPDSAEATTEDVEEPETVNSIEDSSFVLPHPSLTPFYIMDYFTGQRITPNAEEPFKINNEWFDMEMIVLIRTPDADDDSLLGGSPSNQKVSSYMRGKARRWEFQYQMKLKKRPDGKAVYFACHLDDPIKMGIIQRACVGAAMSFIKT